MTNLVRDILVYLLYPLINNKKRKIGTHIVIFIDELWLRCPEIYHSILFFPPLSSYIINLIDILIRFCSSNHLWHVETCRESSWSYGRECCISYPVTSSNGGVLSVNRSITWTYFVTPSMIMTADSCRISLVFGNNWKPAMTTNIVDNPILRKNQKKWGIFQQCTDNECLFFETRLPCVTQCQTLQCQTSMQLKLGDKTCEKMAPISNPK